MTHSPFLFVVVLRYEACTATAPLRRKPSLWSRCSLCNCSLLARVGLFGGVMAILFQTQIEISDGFSARYGFSRTDGLANLLSFIRLPAPALALTPELRGYGLYF